MDGAPEQAPGCPDEPARSFRVSTRYGRGVDTSIVDAPGGAL